jgi:hypothetical protein
VWVKDTIKGEGEIRETRTENKGSGSRKQYKTKNKRGRKEEEFYA